MSSNSKPEGHPAQASRKRPLTRSEEENAEKKELEMTKAYIPLRECGGGRKVRLPVEERQKRNPKCNLGPQSEKDLYKQQEKRIEKAGPIRRCFRALFNTSYIGINAGKTGEGKKARSEQNNFRKALIKAYDAGRPRPGKKLVHDVLFDVATGLYQPVGLMVAAHLVPRSLGTDIMVTLFGKEAEAEMYSPRNGLLLHKNVEKALDLGLIAIVPDLAEDAKEEEWEKWESSRPRGYKWKVMDNDAKLLEENCWVKPDHPESIIMVRELDGKPLQFRETSDHRPRARYLYFLFVSALLKKAWDHKNRRKPEAVQKDQIGKRMWATKGRYLHRAMLVAMSQEAGHHLDEDWDRPPHPGSDEEELQPDAEGAIGLIAIAKYIATSQDTRAEEEDSSDGECETQPSEVEDEN
ncbi:hypothetical protein NCU08538 [Neurospora crassa OR74A]|uniref:HNH nuclease domain-containing protein n=1 Tax=Neurospora crassa (strain ATCC 24698 / 74-OR23-1A / CBS 708.71 / DSM 1257 / FGSC 987) TaxID=367110 RepID=Q7SBL2_NEUCR|nr:hypothetical protein NCU08538 [Neurospora crassa OR74A]EAA33784.2 hypothetical protein NCU08538 [Neurospora crassa OR74A]|eukprot:XP_963020.2 hypothetical protein NCU08538 [Neurospora crassa OR74A]